MASLADIRPRVGVGVVAHRQGHVALGLRRYRGKRVWSLPGGKVERFESLISCSGRELTEETGLVARRLKAFVVFEFLETDQQYHSITFGAVAHSVRGELTNCEPHLFKAWEWFDFTRLPAPLFPPTYHLLKAYRSFTNQTWRIPRVNGSMRAECRLLSV